MITSKKKKKKNGYMILSYDCVMFSSHTMG